MILSIDVESRAVTDLTKCGAHSYWACEHADVLCAAWRLDSGEHGSWVRGDPVPPAVQAHILSGGTVSAYNANFERLAFNHVLGPRYGWPVPRLEQWDDTAAMAAAMGLPRALGDAARAMGLSVRKDEDGRRLIRKFSIPRKARKGETPGALYWNEPEDHPEDFAAFVAYCETDVVVERALRDVLVPLSDAETEVWRFDARMNDRGIRLDRALVEAMLKIVEQAKDRLDKAMAEATGWEVTAASQVSALTAWLVSRGVPAESLAKDLLDELLRLTDIPPDARAALEIRKEAAKASTAKLAKMLQQAQRDDRLRGQVLYHGAATGRWSGKGVQVQNLPRGSGVVKSPDTAAPHMLGASADFIDMLYGPPMSAVSDMLRACLTASPNHRLIAADYSSIEGRGTAWLAGEESELEAYRLNDAGKGPGVYEIAAANIFNVDPYKVSKAQRQVGKTACIAEGTLVVVRNIHGQITAKPIQDVQITDLAWDGEDWVEHGGVVCNGERECVELNGTKLTPDHLIWCGASTGWVEAAQVVSSESIRLQASATAAECWSFPDTWSRMAEDYRRWSSSATAAGPNTASPPTLFRLEEAPAATPAQKKRPAALGRSTTCITRGLARMWSIARDCSTGFLQSIPDARTPGAGNGSLMAGAVSAAGGPTSMATSVSARGAEPASSRRCAGDTKCSGIWSAFLAGITRTWRSTVSTMIAATNRGTSGFQPGATTPKTSGKSISCLPVSLSLRQSCRVYDLLNCGPNSRFMVFSDEGPLLVHNCLALGYQGGVMAFHNMARIYGVDMAEAYEPLRQATDGETWERALERYEECLGRGDTGTDILSQKAWVASEVTKVKWRENHPATVALWHGLEDAAREAVLAPGSVRSYGRIAFTVRRNFLWMRLPSGRCIAYGAPKVKDEDTPWGGTRKAVTALGVNSTTNKWERHGLYGGVLTSNAVQGLARDLMANGMLNADKAGYPVVLTVHDEAVADVEEGFGSLAEFERLLCAKPEWAKGLPLVADGWEGHRYRK